MSSEGSIEYPSQHPVVCEVCGSSVSVNWFCKNCPGSMCDNCKVSHNNSGIIKKHLIVPRTTDVVRMHGPAKIAEECRVHPGKEIIIYCNKCMLACCVSCLVEQHQLHEMALIEEKYLAAEKRLNDYNKELESDVKPKLMDLKQKAQQLMTQSEQYASDAGADVNAFRKEVKQAVDDSCDAVIKYLQSPNDELQCFIRNVESKLQNVDDLKANVTSLVREGKLSLIEYKPPSTDTLIPTLELRGQPRLRFTPNRDTLLYVRNMIGTVQQENSDGKFDDSYVLVEKISSFKSRIGARTICIVNDENAWIARDDCDSSDTMIMYDQKGQIVKTQTVCKGCPVYYITVRKSGELIVSNGDKKVRLVKECGTVSVLIDAKPSTPDGLYLTEDENIVVCMRNTDHVVVYSSDGSKKLRQITAKDAQGYRLFKDPFRVIQNCSDMCVVNVFENVVCVDERGGVRWVYDGKQAKLPNKFNPYGICKDKFHNLLVTDPNNNCVHYVDREGQLIQVVFKLENVGIESPTTICLNSTGKLWLGSYSLYGVLVGRYFRNISTCNDSCVCKYCNKRI